MQHIELSLLLEAIAALITSIGGIYSIIHHITGKIKKNKEKYRQEILNEAKEEMAKVEASLELKIKSLELELSSQKESVSRDFGHMREIYNAEIAVLGDKIDNLRSDLADQHQSMVALLTKLVSK